MTSQNRRISIKNQINNFSQKNCLPEDESKFKYFFEELAKDFSQHSGTLNILSFSINHTRDFFLPFLLELEGEKLKAVYCHVFRNREDEVVDEREEFLKEFRSVFKKANIESLPKEPEETFKNEDGILINGVKKFPIKIIFETIRQEEIINFEKSPKLKYDLIFCCFQLHFQQNWRLWIHHLFMQLNHGGCFVYARVYDDFEILDCRFDRKNVLLQNKDKAFCHFFDFMKELDAYRSGKSFFWQPELRMSNVEVLDQHLFGAFEKSSQVKVSFKTLECSCHEIIQEWIRRGNDKRGLISSLDIGIDINYKDLLDFKHQPSKQSFVLEKKIELTAAKKFNLDYGNRTNKLNHSIQWSFIKLMNKIERINDHEFSTLAKKVLDLLLTHDTFLPFVTKYCAIVGWDRIRNNYKYPILYAQNKFQKIPNSESVEKEFSDNTQNVFERYLSTNNGDIISLEEFFFSRTQHNFPVRIVVANSSILEFEQKKISSEGSGRPFHKLEIFTNGESQGMIGFKLTLNDKNQVTFMTILLPEIFNDKEGKWITFGNNGIDLDRNTLKYRQFEIHRKELLEYEFGKSYIDRVSSHYKINISFPDFELKPGENNSLEILERFGFSHEEDKQKIYKEFIQALICAVTVHSLEPYKNHLMYFPSSIIEDQTAGKGPGGIILFENQIPNFDNLHNIKQLIRERNRNLARVCNLIFYKVNVVESVGKDFLERALKAAVAAIISRNGSHGLGSHVLPTVSHIAHNPYDNQQLFTYLEQRLDFIAQVASEFPSWSFPAWFTSDLMMRFYLQRTILNTLVKTEDITAYEFDFGEKVVERNWFNDYKKGLHRKNKPKRGTIIIVHGFVNQIIKNTKENVVITIIERHPDNPFQKDNLNNEFVCNFPLGHYRYQDDESLTFKRGLQIRVMGELHQEKELKDCKLIHQKLVIKIRKRIFADFRKLRISPEGKWKDHLINNNILNSSEHIQEAIDVGKKSLIKNYCFKEGNRKRTKVYGVIWQSINEGEKGEEQVNEIILLSSVKHPDTSKLDGRGLHIILKNPVSENKKILLTAGRRIIVEGIIKLHSELTDESVLMTLEEAEILEVVGINYLVGERLTRYKNDDRLNQDMLIAIPGGVIGYQAFYTILENIMRNAAKHDWIRLKREDRFGKNLEIKIELEEKKDKNFIICKIWTNASDLRSDGTFIEETILDKEFDEKHKLPDPKLPVHHRLNRILRQQLIDDNGELQKNYLGISETKIAAGFLSNQKLKLIGGFPGKKENIILQDISNQNKGFIKASAVWEADGLELVPRLGYKIKLLKPKELIILYDEEASTEKYYKKEWKAFFDGEEKGCRIESYFDFIKRLDFSLDYDFYVLHTQGLKGREKRTERENSFLNLLQDLEEKFFNDELSINELERIIRDVLHIIEFYPYRFFLVLPDKKRDESLFFKKDLKLTDDLDKFVKFIKQRIYFIKQSEFESLIKKEEKRKNIAPLDAFKIRLYDLWLQMMIPGGIKGERKVQPVIFDLGLSEKGYKKNQLIDTGVIRGTFQTFKKFILDEFIEVYGKEKLSIQAIDILRTSEVDKRTFSGQTTFLKKWLGEADKSFPMNDLLVENFTKVFEKYKELYCTLYIKRADQIETLPMIYRPIENLNPTDNVDLNMGEGQNIYVNHLLQNGDWKEELLPDIQDHYKVYDRTHKTKNKDTLPPIGYLRHGQEHGDEKKGKYFYLDYLSGGQIFYSLLKEYPIDKKNIYPFNRLLIQLLENPIPKIMIIDERVIDYVNHNQFRQRLSNLNIIVPDKIEIKETSIDQKSETNFLTTKDSSRLSSSYIFRTPKANKEDLDGTPSVIEVEIGDKVIKIHFHNPKNTTELNNTSNFQFRISNLVIHHSIIKRFFGSEELPESPTPDLRIETNADKFIRAIKLNHIPSVIITSGKGEPADLSQYAKFLPFSNIENYILQSRPEKFLLTQILLKTIRSDFEK